MNTAVDAYINRSEKWPAEMSELRAILLGCGLTEDIKWGKPCFSHESKNIAIIQEMNDFLALMFFKGALLSDPEGCSNRKGQTRDRLYACSSIRLPMWPGWPDRSKT